MKIKLQTTAIFFLILSLFISGCGPASPTTAPDPAAAVGPTSTPTPSDTATSTLAPTDAPTPTVYPPIFEPEAIGDNRELASFILNRTDTISGGGEVDTNWERIGYIKEPFSAYNLSGFSFENSIGDSYFLIDGRLYTKDGQSGPPWYYLVHLEPDPTDIDFYLQGAADMRQGNIMGSGLVLSAQFVGQEDFEGISANHFTLDQTNLRGSDPSGTYKIEQAQGDLYLTQDGNYLLYFHLKLTGNVYPGNPDFSPGVREITEELTSINQLTEITLPADFPEMELNLGLPLPAGTTLHSVETHEVRHGDFYEFFMPETVSPEEFYRNLVPTNGWTVLSIGKRTDPDWCQSQDCVILEKGNAQVILFLPEQCPSRMPADYVCIWAEYQR